jgi:predicted dehydrogenase
MSNSSSPPPQQQQEITVVLVGCGCPLRSMGWYHATQILLGRCCRPLEAKLRYIVEPFYMTQMGSDIDPVGYKTFQTWKAEVEKEHGVQFFASTKEVPTADDDNQQRLAIISARTSDNPKLFEGCVNDIGAKTIFLEKPGAPTVRELESMAQLAQDHGCRVFMGFNKNVSSYLTRARSFADGKSCEITFLHNNNYANTPEELSECFERNAEGMLKNMAIHELAILVTYYGVTVETIASVQADQAFSSCQTLTGPSSGKMYTDFDKLKFKITTTTTNGNTVCVAADRCGGDDSVAIVTDAASGNELARYTMPDEDAVRNIPVLKEQIPGAMPYFYAQDPDYLELKRRVILSCLDGSDPEGVATIDIAINTLKVAEYLTPILQEQLK